MNKLAFLVLLAVVEPQDFVVFNRSISSFSDGSRKGVRLDERPGDGVAYLRGVEFSNGTIECDIKGKDVQGQSFVGIAFHGVDSTTYDAIYFRPFNFKTPDPARHGHAVQYISHPTYPWQKLRAERPEVSVFVGDAKEPSLVVNQLSDRTKGRVGLWVGNSSGGDFADLKIMPP